MRSITTTTTRATINLRLTPAAGKHVQGALREERKALESIRKDYQATQATITHLERMAGITPTNDGHDGGGTGTAITMRKKTAQPVAQKETRGGPRVMSAEARKRIGEATRKRWAAYRAQKAKAGGRRATR